MKKIFPYNIRKSLTRILPFGLLMMLACHKDPTPSPEPDPDVPSTHVYPDTIYVPFEFGIYNPNLDTIRFYAHKPGVKKIIMDMAPMDSLYTSGWGWRIYRSVVDTFDVRCKIAPDQVIGRGTIIVKRVIPDGQQHIPGLPRSDSTALKNMGFNIYARYNH